MKRQVQSLQPIRTAQVLCIVTAVMKKEVVALHQSVKNKSPHRSHLLSKKCYKDK